MDVVAKTKMVEYEFEFYQQLNPGAEMPAGAAKAPRPRRTTRP